ncbi:MAG: thioredoxin [Candidatus Azobacteroides sp.]|nr:thioredoxin [Candidatus Azobacteroides sp.]
MAKEFTEASFEEIINSGKPVMVDFWAEWCGPCRKIAPMIDELSEEYSEQITIGKINVEEEADLSEKYSIRSIPTLLFFKDGQLVDKHIGDISRKDLVDKITAVVS